MAFEGGGSREFGAGFGLYGGALMLDLGGSWTNGSQSLSGARISGLSLSLALGFVFTELGT